MEAGEAVEEVEVDIQTVPGLAYLTLQRRGTGTRRDEHSFDTIRSWYL
jgi:hypothetical protein